MERTAAGWTVLDREAGILTTSYEFTNNATANTFVVRLPDETLLVVSPSAALTDAMAEELDEFGPVGAIMANNGFHHLGQAAWRARYPDARCFAPTGAAERIRKKSSDGVDSFEPLSALEPLLGDDIGVFDVPNSKCGESWVWAKTGDDGWAYYVSDVLANMQTLPPSFVPRMLFKLTKSAPGFRVFHLALWFIVKDKRAALQGLDKAMAERPPSVIVCGHGALLSEADVADRARAVITAAL